MGGVGGRGRRGEESSSSSGSTLLCAPHIGRHVTDANANSAVVIAKNIS